MCCSGCFQNGTPTCATGSARPRHDMRGQIVPTVGKFC
jgi:hypothetical protein